MTLKRITTRYLQSHREITIDLPEKGLIGFYGDNSNGKSVIVKATDDIVKNNITKPKCRLSLVNRDSGLQWGEIEYERYDGMILLVHIHLEAAQTWFELVRPGDTNRNRAYLSSKLLPEYVREFGFHYLPSRDISLNICDSDDAVLFFKTSHKLNFDVLDSALNDTTAQRSLEGVEKTLKDAQASKQIFEHQIEVCDAAMAGLKMWDIQEEETKKKRLTYICDNLEKIHIPSIPELPPLPQVTTLDIHYPVLPSLRLPSVINVQVDIPDIISVAKEMEELRAGKCPMCGRLFIEGEHNHV